MHEYICIFSSELKGKHFAYISEIFIGKGSDLGLERCRGGGFVKQLIFPMKFIIYFLLFSEIVGEWVRYYRIIAVNNL